ncbi:protein of unknown function [Pseudomonas sp. JV241A]|nr:protein of unknown function [Pseudomonas sp. JV241A]
MPCQLLQTPVKQGVEAFFDGLEGEKKPGLRYLKPRFLLRLHVAVTVCRKVTVLPPRTRTTC